MDTGPTLLQVSLYVLGAAALVGALALLTRWARHGRKTAILFSALFGFGAIPDPILEKQIRTIRDAEDERGSQDESGAPPPIQARNHHTSSPAADLMERRPHGRFRLWREGQTLLCDAEGPSNEEIVTEFVQAVQAEIHGLEQAPGSTSAPCVMSACSPRRPKRPAILTGAAPRELEETQIRRIHDAAGINYAFFPDIASARTWTLVKLQQPEDA